MDDDLNLPFRVRRGSMRISVPKIHSPVAHNYYEHAHVRGHVAPHPAVLILCWACLTVAIQSLQAAGLLFAGIPLLVLAYVLSAARLFVLLRRTRWIMFSLLFIYAYATPGMAVWEQLEQLSPTREGVTDGLLQIFRLAITLGGLAILLGALSQVQLIGGLYTLAYPLRYVGVSRERIAVRLALTLHYAESAMLDTATNWRAGIEQMLAPAEIKRDDIEIYANPLTLRDGILMLISCTLLVMVWV